MKLTIVSGIVALIVGLTLAPSSSLGATPTFSEEDIAQLYENRLEIQEWFLSGFYGSKGFPKPEKSPITCAICETAVVLILNAIRTGTPDEDIINSTIGLCKSLNIVTPDICDMVVPIYADPMFFMVKDHPWITTYDICGIILGGDMLPGCFYMNSSMTDWVVDMDYVMKPPVTEKPLVPDGTPMAKVIHLTDVHPDLHYVEGSLNDCGKPLCCRPDPRDDPSNSSIAAGPWGDFLCDFPIDSTRNVFMEAAARHPDADFVLMTGDLVHHQIWNTTVADNLDHYWAFKAALDEAFPSQKVYPAIGNHEPHPCNMFPPQEVWADYDLSWMYNVFADMYSNQLTPEALVTFRRAGYYTQLHKPGFRIVVLNTNFCYSNNFWIIYKANDPEGHLQWFSNTMYAAERAGEKVWIVGHVPPGSKDCWSKWSQQFHRIINRYEAIIMAQFYGHTHNDEFRVFFDASVNPPRPTGSLYIGASVTPYTKLNPGYKVFYADGVRPNATWEILDHETWVYDLAAANEAGLGVQPEFYKEYSAKETYGLASFRPAALYDFVERMAVDDQLFLTYYRHWYKDSGKDSVDTDCPSNGDVSECKFDLLCEIVSTDYTSRQCDRIKALAGL